MRKTVVAWLVAIAGLLLFEAYAVLNSTPGDTLSEAVWKYGMHPMIPFAVGVLIGHFFWQRKGGGTLLILLALPLLLGAERCKIELPQPSPSPTATPVPTPTPEPTPSPTPEPTPTPTPVPSPTPTPEPDECTLPLDGAPVMGAGPHGNRIYDCTPKITNAERCKEVGMYPRITCPAAPEGHPQRYVCELKLMGGHPVWDLEVESGNLKWGYEDDEQWKARVTGAGRGRLRACFANRKACSPWIPVEY